MQTFIIHSITKCDPKVQSKQPNLYNNEQQDSKHLNKYQMKYKISIYSHFYN